jgi:putative aminopeptidase FrvX
MSYVPRKQLIQRLQKYSDAFGPAGFENEAAAMIRQDVEPLVDDIIQDPIGNLIAIKRGQSDRTVMLDAHMDEVGVMVRHIEDNGFIRFAKLGGWDDRIFPGLPVTLRARKNNTRVSGVIGMVPPHLTKEEDRKKQITSDDLFIDVGADSKAMVEDWGLQIGDPGVPHIPYRQIGNGVMAGKAFDDRAGCVAAALTLEVLKDETLPLTLAVNFAIGEEMGLRGAKIAAYRIDPVVGLALEGTVGSDFPGVPPGHTQVKLGGGPVLTVADRSVVVTPKMVKFLEDLAAEKRIPYQYKMPLVGGSDAGAIHLSRGGVPCGVVATPCRYIHSPQTLLKLDDLDHVVTLTVEAMRNIHKIAE